jgi:hypothetical protein
MKRPRDTAAIVKQGAAVVESRFGRYKRRDEKTLAREE